MWNKVYGKYAPTSKIVFWTKEFKRGCRTIKVKIALDAILDD